MHINPYEDMVMDVFGAGYSGGVDWIMRRQMPVVTISRLLPRLF